MTDDETIAGGRAGLPLLRKIGAAGYLLSATTSSTGLLVTRDPTPGDHRAVLILAALMAVMSGVLLAGRRLPEAVIKLIVIGGGVLFTSATVAFVSPVGVTPLYYVYPAMTSGYFGTRRDAVAQYVLTAISFAAALVVADGLSQKLLMYTSTLTIVGLVSLCVSALTERADALLGQVREVASTDGLTGLLNRRAFAAAVERELARARTFGVGISLVLFDLDHFKMVNDRHGHAAGDEALRRFAGILAGSCGPADVAARMGGEEFVVALFDADAACARRWAEEVAERLRRETAGEPVALTTSAGVVTCAQECGTLDELLLGADRALYAAKAAGRRRVMAAGDPGVGPLAAAA